MEEIEIGGTVMLPVGANLLQVEYVNWQGRAWLAPVWLESPDGTMRPIRLIAPRFAQGAAAPPGADVLNIFQGVHLSHATLEQGFIPPDLAPILQVVENPNVLRPKHTWELIRLLLQALDEVGCCHSLAFLKISTH